MSFKTMLTGTIHNVGFAAREHSPEILMVCGAISMIGTVVSACRATLKFQEDIAKHNDKLEKLKEIRKAQEDGTVSDEAADIDVKQYRMSVYVNTMKRAVQAYWKTIALGIISLACFGGAFGIIKKRFVSLAAAYAVIAKDKEHLEECIKRDYGEDVLRKFKEEKKDDILEMDENGNVKDSPNCKPENNTHSAYAKFFDEANPNFEKDAESNRIFLAAKERWANQILQERASILGNRGVGHLFLNEMYRMLNMEETQAGQIMGWTYYADPAEAKKHPESAGFVSFGIFDIHDKAKIRFVNGVETAILLDFNVDKEPILGRTCMATS